jgi:mitochondrial fission protein ELM1
MSVAPLHVWVLSDAQPGHFNLSRGVVAALERIRPVQVHWLTLSLRLGLARNPLRLLLNHAATPPAPGWLKLFYVMPELPSGRCDLVVSAGGKTSFANAWLAKRLGAKNIFAGSLRRLSPGLFDVVVTLEPIEPASPNNLVLELPPSTVAMNDLACHAQALRDALGLGDEKLWTLMIGGDGAGYRYREADWAQLARLLDELSRRYNRRWLLLSSRRTGRDAERLLQNLIENSCVAATRWYGEGGDFVVEACLGAAERVFVTEDSMTMVTEAICSRRPVVNLRPAEVAATRRYAAMIARFEQRGWLVRYAIEELAAEPQRLDDIQCKVLDSSPLEDLAAQLAGRLQLDQ